MILLQPVPPLLLRHVRLHQCLSPPLYLFPLCLQHSELNTDGSLLSSERGAGHDVVACRVQILKAIKKKYHIGCFNNIEDAKKARQEKAKELFGEFINTIELEININNVKPKTKLKLNININNNEQNEIDELEKEFEELLK